MSWGGTRQGSGRPPLPEDQLKWPRKKKSARKRVSASARKPLHQTTAQPTFTTTPSNNPADKKGAMHRGLANYEGIQALLERALLRRSGEQGPKQSPFRLPDFPKGALPAKKHQMALDEAVNWAAAQWDGGYLNGVAAEGQMFLGYTYLAELAQRPEYRTAVDTIATESTRKWIKFSTIDSEEEKDEASGKKDPDGAKAKAQPGDKPDEANAPKRPPTQAQDRAPDDTKKQDVAPKQDAEQDDTIAEPGAAPERTKKLSVSKDNEKNKKIKELTDFMDHLQVRDRFAELSAQDGYYGRTHLYLDSGANAEELKTAIADLNNNKVIKGKVGKKWLKRLQVVEPVWVYPTTYNATNPLAPDWYNPQVWYVMGQEIHASRLLMFQSRPVPDLLKPSYAFGGLSLSQIMKPYVDIWLTTRQSIGQLIHAFSVMVLKTDVATILQAGSATTDLLLRAEIFNALRDSQGLMVLNKDTEDFDNVSAPLSGLDKLQSQAQEHMLSVTRIPAVKAFGIQPEGLNASSEGEMRAFNDTIKAYQLYFMKPKLDLLVNICQLTLWGAIDEDITYDFESLVELTEKEKGEKRKADAETGDILIQGGVISPAEERKRIISEPDSQYHGLDPDDVPEPPPDPMDEGGGGDDPFGGGGGKGGPGGDDDERRKVKPKPPGGADAALDDDLAFDDFSEADHPRGQPGNAGQFGSGGAGKGKGAGAGKGGGQGEKDAPRAALKLSELKKVGKQLGSNPGGQYADADGNKFYIKDSHTPDHAKSELLAASLYALAGSPTLKYVPVEGGGKVATEWQTPTERDASKFTKEQREKAQENFATHAWLANWDAAGLEFDNQNIIDGVPVTVDVGGSLAYRAQGGPKGAAWGNKVGEWDTLRDKKMNPQNAEFFGSMTPEQLKSSALKVTRIPDAAISDAVKKAGMPDAMAAQLIARKRDIASKVNVQAADSALDVDHWRAVMAIGEALAFDAGEFDESKHKRDDDGKFSTTGGGGAEEPKDAKKKKDIVSALLAKGTTVAEVIKETGWKKTKMPKIAAMLGLKLETTMKDGVKHYKGVKLDEPKNGGSSHTVGSPIHQLSKGGLAVYVYEQENGMFTLSMEDEDSGKTVSVVKNIEKMHDVNVKAQEFLDGADDPHDKEVEQVKKFSPKFATHVDAINATFPNDPKNSLALKVQAAVSQGDATVDALAVMLSDAEYDVLNHAGLSLTQAYNAEKSKQADAAKKKAELEAKMKFPEPTPEEMKKASKGTTLPMPSTAPGVKEIVDAFNNKYAGKTLTDPAALKQKVNDYKSIKVGIEELEQAAKKKSAAAQKEANAKAANALKESKAKHAAKNAEYMKQLGINDNEAEGFGALVSMMGGSISEHDLIQKFKNYEEQAKGHGYPISGFQYALVRNYINGGYTAVNDALRESSMSAAQHVYTKLVNDALTKMPKYTGKVVRGTSLPANVLARYQPGKVVMEHGFTSTGIDYKFGGSVHYTIKANGMRGADFSKGANQSEAEVLFKSGTPFLVHKVEKKGGVTHIEMEEVEHHG